MFSEILAHFENNYEKYNDAPEWHLDNMNESTLSFFKINVEKVDSLPKAEDLMSNTIYCSYFDGKYHAIYSYGNGFIFNSNQKMHPIDGYESIYPDQFEPTYSEHSDYFEFLGTTGNLGNLMNAVSGEENCEEWCFLIAYLNNSNYSINNFLTFIYESGEYKKQSFNKLHFLAIFINYCSIINESYEDQY